MILTDTSVWADHLRVSDETMLACLEVGDVLLHPFVLGELSLGTMPRYDAVINALKDLPQSVVASPDEVLELIRQHRLMGTGVGYVDAHLLASARLTPETLLWTRDKRLKRMAETLGIASALP